jgi:peptide deformylase
MQLLINPINFPEVSTFDFNNPQTDPVELATNMTKFIVDNGYIGIAGNQIGINYAVMALAGQPNIVAFNPKLVNPSEEHISLEESDPSYPSLIVKIKRPRHVRVRFTTPNGQVETRTWTGMSARVFQRLYTTLYQGHPFYRTAGDFHRHQALRKWKRTQKTFTSA